MNATLTEGWHKPTLTQKRSGQAITPHFFMAGELLSLCAKGKRAPEAPVMVGHSDDSAFNCAVCQQRKKKLQPA